MIREPELDNDIDDSDSSIEELDETLFCFEDKRNHQNSNTATQNKIDARRKIEAFWDDYELNKTLKDNIYDGYYADYLLDGELH